MDMLIAVDGDDRELFQVEKMECHRKGILHRAVSGFLISPDGRFLVQRRAESKYHSAGLLANACCSHPRPGESPAACIRRRTGEELGLTASFEWFGRFRYRAPLANGLWEHEVVHLFVAVTQAEPRPAPEEVAGTQWMDQAELAELAAAQQGCAPWFLKYLIHGIVDDAYSHATKMRLS